MMEGYMLTTFVPDMYRSGETLLWELFDVRILYREELTRCHVFLVNNISSSSEMPGFLPWTQRTNANVLQTIYLIDNWDMKHT